MFSKIKSSKIFVRSQEVPENGRSLISKLVVVAIAGIATVFILFNFIASPFIVNGISMQPTFHTGNIVIVWKLPQTWAAITGTQYIPSRGDIVVLSKTPVLGEQLIKRVIGLPNETITINDSFTLYNSDNKNGLSITKSFPWEAGLQKPVGNVSATTGPGQIFVMGDNREPGASIDSRSSLGSINSKTIIGKVVLRIYPFKTY